MRKTVGGVMHRVYAGQFSGGKLVVGRGIAMNEGGEIRKFFSGRDGNTHTEYINSTQAKEFAKGCGIQDLWNRHANAQG